MNRSDPVEMRKALKVADEFKKAGILFVSLPVLSKEDGNSLCVEAVRRLDVLEQQADSAEYNA